MRLLVHKYSQSARIDEADHKCLLMVTNFHIHDTGCFEFLRIYFLKVLNNVYTKFSVILVAWAWAMLQNSEAALVGKFLLTTYGRDEHEIFVFKNAAVKKFIRTTSTNIKRRIFQVLYNIGCPRVSCAMNSRALDTFRGFSGSLQPKEAQVHNHSQWEQTLAWSGILQLWLENIWWVMESGCGQSRPDEPNSCRFFCAILEPYLDTCPDTSRYRSGDIWSHM